MMDVDVPSLLEGHKKWVKQGDIRFLEEDTQKKEVKSEILKCVEELRIEMEKEKGSTTEFKWHDAHKKGRNLWEMLASSALRNIDPESKGNSTLFDFLTAEVRRSLQGLRELPFHFEPDGSKVIFNYRGAE
jgi:hypothetical protein